MTYIMGSATVPSGTTGTLLFNIPPSYAATTFFNISAATVWLGTNTAVTSANGVQCHSIPTTLNSFASSRGVGVYGTTGSTAASSVATIQYFIVTDQ
jgi:hypothetical protein